MAGQVILFLVSDCVNLYLDMAKEKSHKLHQGEKILAEWKAPEFRNWKKIKDLKFGSSIIGIGLLLWAIYNSNLLFFFILLLSLFLIFFMADYRPKTFRFMITDSGVWIDETVHRFIEIDKFWVAPFVTKKDKFFVFSLPHAKDLRIPVPIDDAEKIRQIVNEYVPQSEHRISLFDWIEQALL